MSLNKVLISYQLSVQCVKVIIGGGDGTVAQMLEKLQKDHVDLSRCFFGVLPLGTGNDLSRTLGWGGTIVLSSKMKQFKKLVRKFSHAAYTYVDLWDIKLTCDEREGEILQIQEGEKKPKMEEDKKVTVLKKTFISYMSIGYDARVGFGFDKLRTSSRASNYLIYIWEGLKKMSFGKTMKVNDIIDSFWVVKHDHDLGNKSLGDDKCPIDLVFKTADKKTKDCTPKKCNISI